jgi:hypothetical protein
MQVALSDITSRILKHEAKDKFTGQILSKDITGKNKIDANADHKVTVDELKSAATLAGIDISTLTETDLGNLEKDALQLTEFLQKGGKLSKNTDLVYSYDFIGESKLTSIESVRNSQEKGVGFHRGQSGPEIAKLNVLLANLGFKITPGNEDKFTEETEIFVREFQMANNLLQDIMTGLPEPQMNPGVIDGKTLITMERATKAENPYVSIDAPENNIITEYDIVRKKVKEQLGQKGIDVNKAFEIGEKLTEGSVSVDRKMSSESLCYTAVKKTLENVLGLPYEYFGRVKNPENGKVENGAYAKTAGYSLLDKHPDMFVKLDNFTRNDVQYLPPGAIVVYRPVNSKGQDLSGEAGHIGVQSMQVKGLPVVKVNEENGVMRSVTLKKKDNTLVNYDVMDGFAVLSKTFANKDEIAVGTKLNGMTIASLEEENGIIKSIKLKGTGSKGTYYKTLEVSGNKIILEKNPISHADISDKMRVSPWKSSKVEVYFPISSLK